MLLSFCKNITRSISLCFLLQGMCLFPNIMVEGKVRLPTFLASHMVLQREPAQSVLWGWSEPGKTVTATLVRLNVTSVSVDTRVETDGSWRLTLPPQQPLAGWKIRISDESDTITLTDVAFGDVYLCSGQSNMELTVSQVFNASEEIADSINYPNLRLATVARVTADSPQMDAPSKTNYIWERSSPSSIQSEGGGEWGVYSATCYFFGRELYKHMGGDVPIGLVTSCWGGQKVEVFSSPDALLDSSCGGTRPTHKEGYSEHSNLRIDSRSTQRRESNSRLLRGGVSLSEANNVTETRDGPEPTQLWNGMIYPLLPMRFAGVVWYQGEANAGDPESYSCSFPAMISDWRRKFGIPDLSFVYVELAGFIRGTTWPETRAAQAAALQLPNVGVATAIDLSDPDSPDGNIHPRRKQEVGRRLSLQMRCLNYGECGCIVSSGPQLDSVQFVSHSSSGINQVQLGFSHRTAKRLHLQGSAACKICCREIPFHVMDGHGEWKRAMSAKVRQNQLILSANATQIFGIRYAWEARPECGLYNGDGGPDDHTGLVALPFEWCSYYSGRHAWSGQGCSTGNQLETGYSGRPQPDPIRLSK